MPSFTVAERFCELTGQRPEGVWRAPGRVNLIGEHTDYNGGFALPFAIDRDVTVAARRRPDRLVRCWSRDFPDSDTEADLDHLTAAELPAWARYPIGVMWALEQNGLPAIPGVDMVVESSVPVGAGLSSSAALEAATAVALNDLCHAGAHRLDRMALAHICHTAETHFVGAPVGLLDPLAVLLARTGHALLIDFRSLALEWLPLAAALGPLVVVDTGVRHRNADGAYAARRRSCHEAAACLGVGNLRDATQTEVETGLDGELRRRARHVVSENLRVLETARRLRHGLDIGVLLTESHVSLRDDYEVSCPELDAVVETAADAGASGARLTGAGFGGCAVVLGLEPEALTHALHRRGLGGLKVFPVVPSQGARRLV